MPLLIAIVTALGALVSPLAAEAQAPPDLTGTWNLTFETPRGERTFVVDLTHAADGLTGTLTLPRGQKSALKAATFVDGVLSFGVELGRGQRSMTQRFEGTFEDGVFSGEMQREGGPAMRGRRGPPEGGQGQGRRQGPGPRSFTMVRAGG
jgi:hypothetical protein